MSVATSPYPSGYLGPRTPEFGNFLQRAPHVTGRLQAGSGGTLRLFIEARQIGYFSQAVAAHAGVLGVRFRRDGGTLNAFPVDAAEAVTGILVRLFGAATEGTDFVIHKGTESGGPSDKRYLVIVNDELAVRLLPHLPLVV